MTFQSFQLFVALARIRSHMRLRSYRFLHSYMLGYTVQLSPGTESYKQMHLEKFPPILACMWSEYMQEDYWTCPFGGIL